MACLSPLNKNAIMDKFWKHEMDQKQMDGMGLDAYKC